jgi:hypothetical protein
MIKGGYWWERLKGDRVLKGRGGGVWGLGVY